MKIHQLVQLGEKLSLKYLISILYLFNFMFSQCQGDMNGDGIMNVVDLVASVNLILAGTFECEEESPYGCTDSNSCNFNPNATIFDNSCLYNDCLGICDGEAYEDMCGACDNVPTNDCEQDCNGDWGGNATEDECGVCDGIGFDCGGSCGEYVELWGECYNIEETRYLNLSNSGLAGEIPPEIGNLTNLDSLFLYSNQLSGEIPPEIGNLTNLVIKFTF